jgi:hypothetical protein
MSHAFGLSSVSSAAIPYLLRWLLPVAAFLPAMPLLLDTQILLSGVDLLYSVQGRGLRDKTYVFVIVILSWGTVGLEDLGMKEMERLVLLLEHR